MKNSWLKILPVLWVALLLASCSSSEVASTDSGAGDAGAVDSVATDSGASGATTTDAGTADFGTSDSGAADSGVADVGAIDFGTADSGAADSGSIDSGTADSGTADSGTADSGASGSGTADSGESDSGTADSGESDTGESDTGTTDSGSTDSGSSSAELKVSCAIINTQALLNSGGFVRTVLPADLSQPGAQITIQQIRTGQFTAFDAASGAVDYVPDSGRLPTMVEYVVSDADGVILASHQHRWVFDQVRVMPLGDSITSGVEFFDGSVDQPLQPERVGYRKFLYDQLIDGGYSIDFVGQGGQNAGAAAGLADPQNNGYPGVDIEFINTKLLEVLGDDSADIILLHIGTNNTPQDAAAIDTLLVTLDTWEAENHPVLVLVATITPKRDVAKNAEVDVFNQDLRLRVAARTNDKLLLVEQNLALNLDDISDEPIGLHPNAAGYQKMANTWFDALTNADVIALERCPP